MEWVRHLVQVLFPPACRLCRRPGEFPLCRDCAGQFRLILPPWCSTCGRPLSPAAPADPCTICRLRAPAFSRARAAGVYEGALREAIHALKFGGCRAIAAPLGDLIASAAGPDPELAGDVVVPVPLHAVRLRERGFNQAELLARRVAGLLTLPCDGAVLRRRRSTGAQSRLTRVAREANVRDTFAAAAGLTGLRVLLVDDVISTGSTASACARALLDAGAAKVVVAAAARALLDGRRGRGGAGST